MIRPRRHRGESGRDDTAGEPLLALLDGGPGPARHLSRAVSTSAARSVIEALLEAPLDGAPGQAVPPRRAPPSLGELAFTATAEALRALAGTRAEALALRELMERHPRSALAAAARRRLTWLAP